MPFCCGELCEPALLLITPRKESQAIDNVTVVLPRKGEIFNCLKAEGRSLREGCDTTFVLNLRSSGRFVPADRAQARGTVLVTVKAPLEVAITGPDTNNLERDAGHSRRAQQR
jgi:hypothetical protein